MTTHGRGFTKILPSSQIANKNLCFNSRIDEIIKKQSQSIFLAALLLFTIHAEANIINHVYLDKNSNVHISEKDGKHRKVTESGNASKLRLSPDKKIACWLILNKWKADDDTKPGSEELVIYRSGKISSIKCTPFIRDYWFWNNGRQIAIDCGGRHFAGREILYDAYNLKEIARFDQDNETLQKPPDWSNGED